MPDETSHERAKAVAENKTKQTEKSVDAFLDGVDETKRRDGIVLIEMMKAISRQEPKMWGPSIIGFGTQHYKSEAGREGDMPLLGFSPRKANLTIYFYEGFNRYSEELSRLGKHKISMGCLYINKLADVDEKVLRKMLEASYALTTEPKKTEQSVDEYVASVPGAARSKFDELRSIVRGEMPTANEVVSYGIVGYKIDQKRARVFVSGWKDYVAMYPIPKNESLRKELEPYVRGKGTLWFGLDEPLPEALIRRVVQELALG